MKLKDVDTIEQASLLRGRVLYIDREDAKMESGVYFIQDIIDLEVVDYNTGCLYGKVTDVLKTGANDVYQITNDKGNNYLIPVIDDVVIKIDIDENKIYISPIEGIFGDEN